MGKLSGLEGADCQTAFNVTLNPAWIADAEREKLIETPFSGRVFTDHVAVAIWTRDGGWQQKMRSAATHRVA